MCKRNLKIRDNRDKIYVKAFTGGKFQVVVKWYKCKWYLTWWGWASCYYDN